MEPSDVINDFIDEDTVVWLGAGLAADQDFPQWPQLIQELCTRCGVAYPDDGGKGTQVSPSAQTLMDLADDCKNANLAEYQRHLVDRFGYLATPNTKRDLYLDLVKLNLRAYVTTNFDHLLSIAARGANRDFEELWYPGLFTKHIPDAAKSTIYYLHGLADSPEPGVFNELVLSTSEFEQAYRDPGVARNVAESLLREWPILFIGVGKGLTQDKYLRGLIESAGALHENLRRLGYEDPPAHLALVTGKKGLDDPEQAEEDARVDGVEDDLAKLGIRTVRIDVPVRTQPHWKEDGGQPKADYGALDRVISEVAERRGLYRQVARVSNYGLRSAES